MTEGARGSEQLPDAPPIQRTGLGQDPALLPLRTQVYSQLDALPEPVVAFIDRAAQRSFFSGLPWFRALLQTVGRPGDEPRIYVAAWSERPVAVLVVRERRAAGRLKTRMLLGPSHWIYAQIYEPILDAELGEAGLRHIAATIARQSPRIDVLRFDGLPEGSPAYAALTTAFRKAGMIEQPFFNFSNWHEDVAGLTVDRYLGRRSRQTRTLVQRTERRFARSGRGRFEVFTGGPEFNSALIDYALVELQSRKGQESYPGSVPAILSAAAAVGAARLGLYYVDELPAAAQAWIVCDGHATLLRRHFNKAFGKLSVGTALTVEMLRHMLARDNLSEIDFGAGGDAYTQKWASSQRVRGGLLVFNSRTPKGLIAALRHIGGHAALTLARRLRRLLRRLLGRA
jgi:CelD/BcsL family acetyltransferase involved in cellulose biosynthesis